MKVFSREKFARLNLKSFPNWTKRIWNICWFKRVKISPLVSILVFRELKIFKAKQRKQGLLCRVLSGTVRTKPHFLIWSQQGQEKLVHRLYLNNKTVIIGKYKKMIWLMGGQGQHFHGLTVSSCRFSVRAIKWQLESRLHHNHGPRD